MRFPKDLSSAKQFLEHVSNNGKSMNEALSSINTAFENFRIISDTIKHLISNPIEILMALQPYGAAILIILILLKVIGFKTDKWIFITVIILILITILC